MKKTLISMALGAGAMYLLDPEHGSERRADLIGKLSGAMPKTADAVHAKADVLTVKAHSLTTQADEKAAEAINSVGPQNADAAESGAS